MISFEPMGMIADLQAIKFKEEDFETSCWKIIKHVGNNEKLSKPILDALIEWFGESSSYDKATERADKILNEFKFNSAQVRRIKQHIKTNSQIYQSKEARGSILKFIENEKYNSYFNVEFKNWYDSKEASKMWMR